jgi:hypothetical protein
MKAIVYISEIEETPWHLYVRASKNTPWSIVAAYGTLQQARKYYGPRIKTYARAEAHRVGIWSRDEHRWGLTPYKKYLKSHGVSGKRRHAKQWKLVTARKGEVLGKERAPSARLALRQHRAKGHGTTGVAAVRAGGKRRHALKQPSVGKLARELNSMLRD